MYIVYVFDGPNCKLIIKNSIPQCLSIFVYFCGRHKNNCVFNFAAPLKKYHYDPRAPLLTLRYEILYPKEPLRLQLR